MFGARGRICAALLLGTASVAGAHGPVRAEGADRVIELFTSQGCFKCPPADGLIAGFARDPGTVALSFPVNYWDYIGWKDTLASPDFSRRQHAYAAARGDGLVYTPQVVVDGLEAQPGSDEAAITRETGVLKGDRGALTVPISLGESNGRVHIDIGPGRPAQPAGVYLFRVVRAKTVEVGRGENTGRSLTYTNVVRAMRRIATWDGEAAHFDVLDLRAEDEGYVVLLQAGPPDRPGVILAAAKTPGL